MHSREISITSACTAACRSSPNPADPQRLRDCGWRRPRRGRDEEEHLAYRSGEVGEPFAQQLRESVGNLKGLPGLEINTASHYAAGQLQSEQHIPAQSLSPMGESRPELRENDPS